MRSMELPSHRPLARGDLSNDVQPSLTFARQARFGPNAKSKSQHYLGGLSGRISTRLTNVRWGNATSVTTTSAISSGAIFQAAAAPDENRVSTLPGMM